MDVCLVVGLLDYTVVLFLFFNKISILFSFVAIPIYTTTKRAEEIPSIHMLARIFCSLLGKSQSF